MVKDHHLSSLKSLAMNHLINEFKRETKILLSIQKLQMKKYLKYQILTFTLSNYLPRINNNLMLPRKRKSKAHLIKIFKIAIKYILQPLNHLHKILFVINRLMSNKKRPFQPSPPSKFQEYKINLDLTKIVILNRSFNKVNTILTRLFS